MVQYFRNYIVRPVGTLSATSTIDSLSSSFICNVNEANTLIPPPYSRTGSPNIPMNIQEYTSSIPCSASQVCSVEQGQNQRSIPVVMANSNSHSEQITLYRHYHDFTNETTAVCSGDVNSFVQFRRTPNSVSFQELHNNGTNDINIPGPQNTGNIIRTNLNFSIKANSSGDTFSKNNSDLSPCDRYAESLNKQHTLDMTIAQESLKHSSTNAKSQPITQHNIISYSNCFDSYDSINDETNDCGLNISLPSQTMAVSTPTEAAIRDFNDFNGLRKNRHDKFSVINEENPLNVSRSLPFSEESPVNAELLKKYSMTMRGYTDSMSGSVVSSLVNFDSPTSPPQATSPTGEIRELLQQIRQLQHNATSPDAFALHDVQSGAVTTISNESSSIGADAYDADESSTSNGVIKSQRPSKIRVFFEFREKFCIS